MIKMSKTFVRWVGKSSEDVIQIYDGIDEDVELCGTWATKGSKDFWDIKDWPPRKVKVTISIEEVTK